MRSEKPTITIIINNLIISPQKWSAICRARDMKLYIISNRLPVKVSEKNGTFSFTRSEGGLATGLDSLQTAYEKHWIGWPGICVDNDNDKQAIGEKLEELNFHPVFLSDTQIKIITKVTATVPSGRCATISLPIHCTRTLSGKPTEK